jgi:hypothetical protein
MFESMKWLRRVASWLGAAWQACRRVWWKLMTRPGAPLPPDLQPEPPPLRTPPVDPGRPKPGPDFDSPAIAVMERHALRQIFDDLDLAMTPRWAFAALEQTRDPVTAFTTFCNWVGVDAFAARERKDAALSRLAVAIDLLSELSPVRDLLSDEGERRIADALRNAAGRDPLARLRDQAARAAAAAKLCRIGARLEELPPCALFSQRLQRLIRETAADPLATALPDQEEGVAAAERLEAALQGLKVISAEVTEILAALQSVSLRGALSADHAAWIDSQTDAFERLLDEIENDPSLIVVDIDGRVTQAGTIRDGLASIRGFYDGGGSGGGGSSGGSRGGPRPSGPAEEIDEALATLGLTRREASDWRMIEKRCRELRKKHNTDDPDHRATDELLRENTARMQAINNAMDTLKKYKDRLADVTA